jgi:hypothetical protein
VGFCSLAAFHETDVGTFHRGLSLIVLAIASAFALGGVVAWWGRPGEPTLLVAAGISVVLLWRDIRGLSGPSKRVPSPDDGGLFREITTKGEDARFKKTDRGQLASN